MSADESTTEIGMLDELIEMPTMTVHVDVAAVLEHTARWTYLDADSWGRNPGIEAALDYLRKVKAIFDPATDGAQ